MSDFIESGRNFASDVSVDGDHDARQYVIGFEDSSGNFVEVGRFNNTADDVTQPLEIKHANSGERITLDSSGFETSGDVRVNGQTSADKLQIGGSDSVSSAPIADSNEFIPLFTQRIPNDFTTTSTSFVQATSTINAAPTFDTGSLDLSNISAFGISYFLTVSQSQSGEDTTTRINISGNTLLENTFSDPGNFAQASIGIKEITGINANNPPERIDVRFEHKVTSGTGTMSVPICTLYGKVK
jgi:hypothetical protein